MTHFPMNRRRFTSALGAAVAATAIPGISLAQKPLQIIVGYPPGGSTDTFARLLSSPLQGVLGRTVVVRNQPGAGGQIAAMALLRDGADGSAVLAINQPDLNLVIARGNAALSADDFRVIMADLHEPRVFLVRNDSNISNFVKFVEQARANPGKLSISVAGGTAQEVMARWLIDKLKIDVLVVNYKGGSEAITALMAGDVTANLGDDFARSTMRSKTTALFIGSNKKSPRWPEAETLEIQLKSLGVAMPSPEFLGRNGVYVVSAAFARNNSKGYQQLQQAILKARTGQVFSDYIKANNIADLSLGVPGEQYDRVFAAEMQEIARVMK
ncbi:tripartite tricarboxylate transporter substrate-binding protein [Variovorax sp. PBL-E5]|uniref:tripartite tricarboxylate transporter substrate-binding protein n=1 Tax=Variovorax sp. PBL-E5 TaxID=434014 RepID=UPI001317F5E9|nr:tripartite tricarboxylate transporter substrate-binding protein [Variovorax sp. PBL-E5]VTU30979.1 Argininosuccinate lyase [Variovorax sp. PBL-E5]